MGSTTRHYSDSEDEKIEDQNWDDWEDQEGSNPQRVCLFCDSSYHSSSLLFKHCASSHSFDFHQIKKLHKLDFYKCVKLINYIRSQVATDKCFDFEAVNFGETILPWDDDMYLKPVLQDDALLYSFDEDDDFEDEDDATSFDTKELEMHLSQFERLKIDEEDISSTNNSELPRENGGKEVKLTFDKGSNTVNPLESLVNGVSHVATGPSTIENTGNGKETISCLKTSADAIKSRNKNYFNAYSSFGIHRDMISDKVRTDAYRQALVENPSLLNNAVVMDVGCGTGILSLFAAQAGASRVYAVEASEKMASVATQIAKDNSLLRNENSGEGSQCNGVIEVVQGMIEDIGKTDRIQPHSVDVLVSEWMGYCLLYESMLSSVLFARDRWLKPGGAILPDTATMFVAGFGRGGASISFWEKVYGFNMSCIGREVDENAAGIPIVDVIDSCNIVTSTKVLQSFDLATMQPNQMDFTAEIELEPKFDAPSDSKTTNWCHGLVVWFETGFTERFCKEKPVNLSTSPYGPSTHWSQTILSFREPIAIASNVGGEKLALLGTDDCPAVKLHSRISIDRALQHRSIDISVKLTGIGHHGRKRHWPVQIFNLY